jgi:hypothetical protein
VAFTTFTSRARHDRIVKRGKSQRAGVPRPEILTESLVWHPGAAAEPLTIELPALFAEAAPERA